MKDLAWLTPDMRARLRALDADPEQARKDWDTNSAYHAWDVLMLLIETLDENDILSMEVEILLSAFKQPAPKELPSADPVLTTTTRGKG